MNINIIIFILILLLCYIEIIKCLRKNILNQFQIKQKQLKINKIKLSNSRSSFSDRIESVKVAITSGIGGTIISSPYSLITGIISQFDNDWQIKHVSLFVSLFLFGITYRYAVRNDENPNLKQGVIGAFALTRALAMVDASPSCSIFAHDCGFPFFIFTIGMFTNGFFALIESLINYGSSAFVIEKLFDSNIISKMK